MKLFKPIAAIFILAAFSACFAGGIKPGDPAPPLKVAKWVKGKPIKSFEKGKVYVVEFWATWCGPCLESIPHISDLAKKFAGQATFTGVSVWETEPGTKDTSYVAKVEKFVKDMGDKMSYNVAVDGLEGTMAKTWMEAAGQNGIPAAFIVDKDSKIAWIGHPMDGMEEALDQIVAGTFDSKAWAAKKEARDAEENKVQEAMNKVMGLSREGKDKDALAELDKVIAEFPKMKAQLSGFRYNLLLKSDEVAAYEYASKLAESEFKNDAMMLNQLAWSIVDDAMKLKSPNYDVAIAIATRGCEVSKWEDAYILDTLAYAHFKKGNVDKAIEIQEKAVKALDKMKSVDAETAKEIRDRLEMFKKKKSDG